MRGKWIVILFCFMLVGCDEGVVNEELIPTKISISDLPGFDQMNDSFFFESGEQVDVSFLEDMISSAETVMGIANMAEPELSMEVQNADGSIEQYHLWIGDAGQTSTLMNLLDTHTIYTIKGEHTDQLLEILGLE